MYEVRTGMSEMTGPNATAGSNRRRHHGRRLAIGAAGIAAMGLIAGCSTSLSLSESSAKPTQPVAAPPTQSPSPTASPTPSPTPVPTSPLSGLPSGSNQVVFGVKIDNIVDARPHVGIQSADLVYVEQVEGGLTRLLALFNSTYPTKIGPVRSARISDIDLLAPFNHIPLAYSGAQMKLYPLIWASPIIDVGTNKGANAYTRDYHRYAPHNLFANGETLVADGLKKNPTLATDMGWIFDKATPAGGVLTTSVKARWPAATAAARWDAGAHRYEILFDGKPEMDVTAGHSVHAGTVIVQYVNQTDSQFKDHWGGVTPLIHSIGSGKAIILRDSKSWVGRWSRPSASDFTSYTVNGQEFPFQVGPVWVLLVKNDRPVTLSPKPTPKPTATSSPTSSSNATDTHAKPKA